MRGNRAIFYYYYTRARKCVEKIRTKQPETFVFESPFSPAVRLSMYRFRVHFVDKPVSGSVGRFFRRSTDVPCARSGNRASERTRRPDHHRVEDCVCVVVEWRSLGLRSDFGQPFWLRGKNLLRLRRVTDCELTQGFV